MVWLRRSGCAAARAIAWHKVQAATRDSPDSGRVRTRSANHFVPRELTLRVAILIGQTWRGRLEEREIGGGDSFSGKVIEPSDRVSTNVRQVNVCCPTSTFSGSSRLVPLPCIRDLNVLLCSPFSKFLYWTPSRCNPSNAPSLRRRRPAFDPRPAS